MERPPGFDEAAAADRSELLTERFGPLDLITAELNRRPRPRLRRRDPAADDTPEDYARRNADLEEALHPTGPAVDCDRWAA